MEKWLDDERIFMKAHGLDGNLSEDMRMQRYLAIPEKLRLAFEREQAGRFFVELDRCHGSCVLRNPDVAKLVVGPLDFHHGRTMQCCDFVVMPNHVHAILAPLPGQKLEVLLQSMKRYSANRINAFLDRKGSLWQKESYDHIVRDDTELHRIRAYIENNPAKAKLKPGEYHYHKAEWL